MKVLEFAEFVTSASGYELLPHPPYLLDVAPSDVCLFPLLKEHSHDTVFKWTVCTNVCTMCTDCVVMVFQSSR